MCFIPFGIETYILLQLNDILSGFHAIRKDQATRLISSICKNTASGVLFRLLSEHYHFLDKQLI